MLKMQDYVYPDGNEEEFVKVGIVLGLKKIVFVYRSIKAFDKRNEIKILSDKYDVDIEIAYELSEKAVNGKISGKVIACGCEKVRDSLNNRRVSAVSGLELVKRKDFFHHRNSALNHVLCQIAKEKNKSIVFSFNNLLVANKKMRALYLGRMRQNMMMCRKFKVDVIIGSFANTPLEMRRVEDIKLLF